MSKDANGHDVYADVPATEISDFDLAVSILAEVIETANKLHAALRVMPCKCPHTWIDGKLVAITQCRRCEALAAWQKLTDEVDITALPGVRRAEAGGAGEPV